MIYYTGDIHGSASEMTELCNRLELTAGDILVLLGDVGANYFGGCRDAKLKSALQALPPTILCVHGNHEIRPGSLPSYMTKEWNGGTVWYEEAYPDLLFAKDGEIFTLDGLRHIVIGGAYSVDKYYRLSHNAGWWPDEQPSAEIKAYVTKQLAINSVDIVLSHTCPFKYEPVEVFLPFIDQSTVDDSTERWLDQIEESISYRAWFCGHWHVDKRVDKIHFLFHGVESADQFSRDSEGADIGESDGKL